MRLKGVSKKLSSMNCRLVQAAASDSKFSAIGSSTSFCLEFPPNRAFLHMGMSIYRLLIESNAKQCRVYGDMVLSIKACWLLRASSADWNLRLIRAKRSCLGQDLL
jgi:hypothetical protein